MRFTVGRMLRGQPRFFAGRYDGTIPVTTGRPDKAREYNDHNIAQIVADLFDALDGVRIGKPQRNWVVVELPEAWT